MRQVILTLDNSDGETSNHHQLLRPSDDEARHALDYACKILSALTRDEIIKLSTQVTTTTSRLVDCDVRENSLPLSSSPRFVDPALISLGKCALTDNITTSHPPASDQSHSPALSSSTGARSEPPSALFDERLHGHSVSSDFTEHRPMQSERNIESPSIHGNCGWLENDFDSAFQELEILVSSRQSPDDLPGSYDKANALDPPICPPMEESGCQGIQCANTDEDATTTSEQETPAVMYERIEGMSHSMSHGLSPHPPVDSTQECWYDMKIVDAKEDVHYDSPDTTEYDKHSLESTSGSPSTGRDGSYSASEPSTLDTPPTSTRTKETPEVADRAPRENCSTGQTFDSCRSGQYSSKHLPAVDDASAEADRRDAEDLSTYDDDFLDLDVRAMVEEACTFLGNNSGGHEHPSSEDTNAMNMGFPRNAWASSSSPPESDDQHTLPSKEQPEISPVPSEQSGEICRKRRHASSSEPQPALPSRNLRARLDKSVVQETGHPSEQILDRWKGRFSHHTLLATLLPDQKDEIETKSKRVLRSDLPDFMDKHTKLWSLNGFWPSLCLHPSKLPNMATLSQGSEIWQYVQAVAADEETHYLKARLADVKLYLEYVEELDRQKARHPGQTAKIRAIDKICGNTRETSRARKDKNRSSFHEHKSRGERWWWSGCYLGRGFIIVCSEETGKKICHKSFKLDAFILYILYNRVDILACCSKFEGLVDGLLTNKLSTDQRHCLKEVSKEEVQEWIKAANVSSQVTPTIDWQAWHTDKVASKAAAFLSTRSNTQC